MSDLPVHGDQVIENLHLSENIRAIRKTIYDAIRKGEINARGSRAINRIEKAYRTAFWATEEGQELAESFPQLPGHARVMIPEIVTIAKSKSDFQLLIELAKSANTRELITKELGLSPDLEVRIRNISEKTTDPSLKKRLDFAIKRWENAK